MNYWILWGAVAGAVSAAATGWITPSQSSLILSPITLGLAVSLLAWLEERR